MTVPTLEAERAAPDNQDMLAAYHDWIRRRGPLGAGSMPERIFFAGWLAARRAAPVAEGVELPPLPAEGCGRCPRDTPYGPATCGKCMEAEERRAEPPKQSIDTPEFRRLVQEDRDWQDDRTIGRLIAYIDGRTDGAAPDERVEDLAALVRKLVRALRKADPDTFLADGALGYLKRKGLSGSPLRAAAPSQMDKGREGA